MNYKTILRKWLYRSYRKRNIKTSFSIISSNCIGGVIYHELGIQMQSPTINLWFYPKDYIKFCSCIDHYLSVEMEEVEHSEYNYPVGRIDDILIFGQHYTSFSHLKKKWNERKLRIDFNNIVLIMSERDGCTYDDIKTFDLLPYKKKVIFVSRPMPEFKSAVFLPRAVMKDGWVHPLTNFSSHIIPRRYLDEFDYVQWLNKEE